MPDLNPQPLPPRTVNVSLPASVMFNIDVFHDALKSVLGHTGCPTCTSGIDFRWSIFQDFVVNEAGQARPVTPERFSQ